MTSLELITVTIALVTLALIVLTVVSVFIILALISVLIILTIIVLTVVFILILILIRITLSLIIHSVWGIFSGLQTLLLTIHSLDFDTKRSHLPGPFRADMCHSAPELFLAFIL
ncbi:hypothetical protein MKX07_000714 [Trichoderma sp. CBMAI-0711]|nr:hypothetical protein MKX07_000714 [Trichoderma sp. CBMAI-0711]